MKYIKLFESFSSNIEENLESLLVDLTDNGFDYETHFINNKEDYFRVEIYKGGYDFEVSEIQDEVAYLVDYMMEKLGPEYTYEFEYEDSWEQHTFHELYDVQDIICLDITFRKKS